MPLVHLGGSVDRQNTHPAGLSPVASFAMGRMRSSRVSGFGKGGALTSMPSMVRNEMSSLMH